VVEILLNGQYKKAGLKNDSIIVDNHNYPFSTIKKFRVTLKRETRFEFTDGTVIYILNNIKAVKLIDPLFYTKKLLLFFTFVFSSFISLASTNFQYIILSLFYATATTLLTWFYIFLIKRSLLKIIAGVAFIFLVEILPVIVFYPAMIYTVIIFTLVIGFIFFLEFILKNKKLTHYYLASFWVLVILFYYFWTTVGIKTWIEINTLTASSTNSIISESAIESRSMKWSPPEPWKIEKHSLFNIFTLRKYPVFQISPYKMEAVLSWPDAPNRGWISLTKDQPEVIMENLAQYIQLNKNFIWAEIRQSTLPLKINSSYNNKVIVYEIDDYYNSTTYPMIIFMVEENVFAKNRKPIHWIFTFTPDKNISADYYVHSILNSFSVK